MNNEEPRSYSGMGIRSNLPGGDHTGLRPESAGRKKTLFVTNTAHNLVRLATPIGFVVVALMGEKVSIRFMQAFGVVYMLTGLIGFVMLGSQVDGYLLGIIHINRLDNFLHVGLGIAIAAAGWVSQNYQHRLVAAQRT